MKSLKNYRRGFSSILAVLFLTLFAVLAISFTAMSNVNVQMAKNHRNVSSAQAAAESGLEYAGFLVGSYTPPPAAYSSQNTVSETEAQQTMGYFADYVTNLLDGSPILNGAGIAWDAANGQLTIPASGSILLNPQTQERFALLFQFQPGIDEQPHHIIVTSIGTVDNINKSVQLAFPITKDSKVLEYAIASRGRMWITGNSTIHGDIFSTWNRPEISPFNMTADSSVLGTINTVLGLDEILSNGYQLETLDADGNPMFDADGNRIYSPEDEIQGYHEGINYDQPYNNDMPGMSIADYNTDMYNTPGLYSIPSCPYDQRVVEYFPHVSGNYSLPSSYSSLKLTRHVYENQTFTNALLPTNRNALFRNCTFEGELYVDCSKTGSTYYNNVRFDNCTFNGPIITNVPQLFKWQQNCLYFTGSATFQNSYMEEATILAPHFNVNLGNTNPIVGETNELTGAIVGGIVDVRGNAQIYGTIISMCDTSQWSSGYVTNIGATLDDGGSETTDPGDVGVISITPDKGKMLPSGMRTPIIIVRDGNSYLEL